MNRTKSPFKHNEDGHLLLSEVAHKEAHEGEVDNVVTNDLSVENVSNYSKKKVKEEKVKEVKEEKVEEVKEKKKEVEEEKDVLGSTFTNETGDEYIKKENGWNVKDNKTGKFRLVNQKMFYDNQLKGSKPETKQANKFLTEEDLSAMESIQDPKKREIYKNKLIAQRKEEGFVNPAFKKETDARNKVIVGDPFVPKQDKDGNNVDTDAQNTIYSIEKILKNNLWLEGTSQGDKLLDDLSIANTEKERAEFQVIKEKGREEAAKFNEDDLKEISTASAVLNDARDDKLNEDYGNLGFTFKNGTITSLDGTEIDVNGKKESEVKEFLENNAVYFENQDDFALYRATKTGELDASQIHKIKTEADDKAVTAIASIVSNDLENIITHHLDSRNKKAVTQSTNFINALGFDVSETDIVNYANANNANWNEMSLGDVIVTMPQIGETLEMESAVTNNLDNAVAIEANRQLNLKYNNSHNQQKNAELYNEELVSLRSEIKADFMESADFLTSERSSNEDIDNNGDDYVGTDYLDGEGNIVNQEAYDDKLASLKQNRVYKNISTLLQSQETSSQIQKNVDDYADGLLSNNVWMNTTTQNNNEEGLTEQTEELDDRQNKLLIKGELLKKEYDNSIKKMKVSRVWLEENTQKSIQSEIDGILKGEYTTKEEVEEANLKIEGIIENYNTHRNQFKSALDEVKGVSDANLMLQVDYKELFKDGEDFANYANHIARNTQWGTQAVTSFGIGALSLVSDATSFVGMIGDIPVTLLDEISDSLDDGNVVKSIIEASQVVTGDGFAGEETTTGFTVIKDAIGTLQGVMADQVEIAPTFEDANSTGDWMEYGVVSIAGQLPQIAAMCLVPGGPYVLGAISAGGQYDQFEQDRILYDKTGGLYGNNVNFLTAVSGSIAVGAINYYSEKITLGQIKGVSAILKAPVGKTVGLKYLRQNVFNPKVLLHTITDLGMESGSEALATLGENGINILAGTQGVDLYDNVVESAVTGALLSSTMKSPALFKHAYAPFASQNSTQAMDSNFLKINDLGEKLMNTNVPSEIESIKAEIAEIAQENTKLMELDIQRVDVLDDSEKRDLINIESDNRKLKQTASEIIKDESLSKKQKQEQLKQINEKLNKNSVRKQEVFDKYPDDVVKEKYKHTMNSVRDQVKIIKEYGGPEINVQEGNTKKFAEVLEAAGVDPVYQTRYGGLMPVLDNYGKVKSYDMFVNKETSLKDGMFTTGAHELLHGIMYQTLKQDNNTQEVVGDALLEALTDAGATISTDSDFNERINSYTKAEGQGEEIMAITSEALMKGEITLPESALDKLGNVYRRVIKNKTNRDIEFNKPKDVLNFIKDYNYSIEKNMSQPAITRMAAKGITGEMVSKFQAAKKNADAKASFSRNVIQEIIAKPDLKTDFDNLVQDNSGVKKYKTKDSFVESTDFFPAYDMIVNSKKLDGLVMANVSDVIQPDQMSDFVNKVKEKIGDRFLKNFDPSINESLFGWLTGVAGGAGQSIVYRAKGDVMNEYNKVIKAASIDKGRVNAEGDTFASQIEADTDVRIESLDDQVMSPGQETAVKQKQEGRVLENLSEVGLENMGEVDAVVMAEVEALIEQNPKDLDKKLNNLIEKEFRKLVVAGMGKVSRVKVGEEIVKGKKKPIYKVDVSGDYKAFHALEFDNMVKSLSTDVIKNNYNNLFDIEQTSREKDRKVNPVTGKITYPGKGIFTIGTNKAKWTKYFTEGGYTTLKERQNGLAKLIAKSKAKTAVDNYIIENSTDINKVVDAKLNLLSESLDNQQKEITSFDKIQFAKQANIKTDSRKQGLPTKSTIEAVKQGKDFLSKLEKDIKILRGKKGKNGKPLYKDNGIALEKAIADLVYSYNIPGLVVLSTDPSEKGGVADLQLGIDIGGKIFQQLNIEVKADGIKIRVGSTLVTKYEANKTDKDGNPLFDNGNLTLKDPLGQNNNTFNKGQKDIDAYYNRANELIRENNKTRKVQFPQMTNSSSPMTESVFFALQNEGLSANIVRNSQVKVEEGGTYTALYYAGKNENSAGYIYFPGKGLYALGEDVLFGGRVPVLDMSLNIEASIAKYSEQKNSQGKKPLEEKYGEKIIFAKVRILPRPDQFKSEVSPYDLADGNSIKELLAADSKLASVVKQGIEAGNMFSKAVNKSRLTNKDTEVKGITVLDFDDTLATSKSMIRYTKPDGTKGTLNAEQYASTYQELSDQGYKWDFSEFNEVVDGKTAPLFNKALKLQEKFGNSDMFVLTARPAEAAPAIFAFLKANGLDIPLKNITGLANSTSEAKALWMAEKVGDGYNDFYFADDALQNVQAVQNMLDQFDVKSKVQQAKIQFSKTIDTKFNDILEGSTGVDSKKRFSAAQAKIRGAKGKYKGLVPASAQDFMGLMYNFLGKGKQGDKDMAFFKKALVDPFARGIDELNGAKQSASNDYKNLTKAFPGIKKELNSKLDNYEGFEGNNFTVDQAVRVYLWNKAGFDVPGLSARDLKSLVDFVQTDNNLKPFADGVGLISKKAEGYSKPSDYWLVENIASDLMSDGSIGDARAEFLGEWQQNVDQIFSPENLNKIQAIYGSKFVEALKDSLYRMQTGKNRPQGSGRLMNTYMNWVNNSVGAIMFFNMRSAVLQTISATNYVNWSDNNPLKAAQAFANQKQYWSDFAMIFNSDYLKQRRSGNQRGVNEADLSAAVAGSDNKAKAALAWLLSKGFLPTQIADSFAIASGGASFFRNRVKSLMKQGMSRADAESKAFIDFQETTEVSQQSARPDMISQQQANPLGRLILSFQNTPMQYGRIMNKAFRDIASGRGDTKTHMSKIIYYGGLQAIVFGALQSALFASLGDEDEEEFDKKKERILNQMVDSWLSVFGFGGKAVSTIKNTIQEFLEQKDKGFNADHAYTILALLGFSPPIGSKARKIYSAIQTDKFNEDVYNKRGFTLDNPIWNAIGNVIEGITNVPLGRLSNKMLNLDNAMDNTNEWWQRAALLLGWNTWDLGIKDKDIQEVKETIKEEKKVETKKKRIIKKEEKKKEKEKEEKKVIEDNIEKQKKEKKEGKKDIKCAAVNKSGKRCGTTIEPGQSYCTIHEKAEQNESGKKSQCKKIKKDKKRCGMQTNSKSGYCYYHD